MAIFTQLRSGTTLGQPRGSAFVGSAGDSSGNNLGGKDKLPPKDTEWGPLKEILQNDCDHKSTSSITPAVVEPPKEHSEEASEEPTKSVKDSHTCDCDAFKKKTSNAVKDTFKVVKDPSKTKSPKGKKKFKTSSESPKSVILKEDQSCTLKEISVAGKKTSGSEDDRSSEREKETSKALETTKEIPEPFLNLRARSFLPSSPLLKKKFRSLYKDNLCAAVLVNNVYRRVAASEKEFKSQRSKKLKRLGENNGGGEPPAKKRKKSSNLFRGVFMM